MAIKDNVIGKKIRNLRKEKGLTQAELAKNKITRNMLSQIESGIALPSLETLEYIAENLKVPTEYLISSGDDLAYYEKKAVIDKIYRAYEAKGYEACLGYLNTLVHTDNEISFIRANVHFELGKKSLFSGALISAKEHFTESLLACANTVLDTSAIESIIPMYEAVATNIQSPLLEYDDKKYISTLNSGFEYEFYKYL